MKNSANARILNCSLYIQRMNRRRFIQSLVAVFSLPAVPGLSLRSVTVAVPTVTAVPAHARSWAVYMSTLHGECTPTTLQNLLNIPAVDAKNYVTQLIADGAIKPNPLLKNAVSDFVDTSEDSLFNRLKERLDMRAQAASEEAETGETIELCDGLESEVEALEDVTEVDNEHIDEDNPVEFETQLSDETDVQI